MSAASYVATVLADSPKAYWILRDPSGLPYDSSGNKLNFVAGGGGGTTYRNAGPFDDFCIRLPPGINFNLNQISTAIDNLTIEMWLNIIALPSIANTDLFSNATGPNGYNLLLQQNGTLQGICQTVAFLNPSTIALSVGGWNHIVMKRDTTVWSYWINGIQDTSTPGSSTPVTPSGAGTAIGDQNSNVTAVDALYAHVAFYETALSPARILAHYTSSTSSNPFRATARTSGGVSW